MEEREEKKLVVKTDTVSIAFYFGTIYLAVYVVMNGIAAIVNKGINGELAAMTSVALIVGLIVTVRSWNGTYTLYAGNEYRGPRILTQLRRNSYEIVGTAASAFTYSQNFLEKKRGSARVNVKEKRFCMYGVRDVGEVRAFIDAYFPKEKQGKKASKKK